MSPSDRASIPSDRASSDWRGRPSLQDRGPFPTNRGTSPSDRASIPSDRGTSPPDRGPFPTNRGTSPQERSSVRTDRASSSWRGRQSPSDRVSIPSDRGTPPSDRVSIPTDRGSLRARGAEALAERTQLWPTRCRDLGGGRRSRAKRGPLEPRRPPEPAGAARLKAVLFQLLVERRYGDAEGARCEHLVPIRLRESLANGRALDARERLTRER